MAKNERAPAEKSNRPGQKRDATRADPRDGLAVARKAGAGPAPGLAAHPRRARDAVARRRGRRGRARRRRRRGAADRRRRRGRAVRGRRGAADGLRRDVRGRGALRGPVEPRVARGAGRGAFRGEGRLAKRLLTGPVARRSLDAAPLVLGLRRRFEQETTYTRVGPVLMAVNPNRVLPEKPGPHVTDVALAAMRGAVDEGRSQAVVISGESGAGKTVSVSYTHLTLPTILLV